ncbi:MAG: MFS transporter [Caulobacteraceae bacterium]
MAVPARTAGEDRLYARITWRLMPLLFVSYVISYIDRVNVGFAKLQMVDDLHFSAAVYGFGAGVFFVGFVLFEIPSNLLLYRWGAKRWLAGIILIWGGLSMLMLLIRTPASFYELRFLLGMAESGFVPGAMYYLTQWYPAHRQGRIFSILIMGASAGGVVVGPLSGWIMANFQHAGGLRNWQWLFLLQGAPAVFMGVALLARLPESVRDASWLTEDEKDQVAAGVEIPNRHALRRSDIWAAFASKPVWMLCSAQFTVNLGIYAGVFWLPSTIRAAGVSDYTRIGLVSALPYALSALVMWSLGRSSDLRRERRWHCFGAVSVAAGGLVLQALSGGSAAGVIGLVVSIAFFIAVTPLVWAQAGAFITGQAAAVGFALINIFAGLAGFLAAYIMGATQQAFGDTSGATYVFAALALAGSLIFLAVKRAPPGATSA